MWKGARYLLCWHFELHELSLSTEDIPRGMDLHKASFRDVALKCNDVFCYLNSRLLLYLFLSTMAPCETLQLNLKLLKTYVFETFCLGNSHIPMFCLSACQALSATSTVIRKPPLTHFTHSETVWMQQNPTHNA